VQLCLVPVVSGGEDADEHVVIVDIGARAVVRLVPRRAQPAQEAVWVIRIFVEAGLVVQFEPRDLVSHAAGNDMAVDESSDGELRVQVGQVEIADARWRDAGEGLARQFPHDDPTLIEVQPVAFRAVLPLGHTQPDVHPIGVRYELAGPDI
jgi:hypothetical protein